MANGIQQGGPPQQLPGWLGSAVMVTTQVGVPTVIAGVLLYFVLFRLDGMLQTIENNEATRTKILMDVNNGFIAAIDRQTQLFEEAIRENIKVNKELSDQAHRDRQQFLDRQQQRKE